ncbi:hypothetical protein GCM10010472_66210 [Pseudonocardia halophobica]|uniref:Uncharacterized protein n=1 Tax=Pseudonocardia halophobica TaxID=29401 RepID=A0A9W6P0K6_9PSEU|nr:hypothetical protein [Pseudonocardia halophobica]GLL15649.1 hypothetical protein GCM10017577_68020 [Pseudonocardia halophobica]
MTDETWLPADFVHPLHVALIPTLHLRPIRASDVDIDLPVVLANQPELWAVYGQAWRWPSRVGARPRPPGGPTVARASLSDGRSTSSSPAGSAGTGPSTG